MPKPAIWTLQAALLVPLLASLLRLINGFRMMRLPEIELPPRPTPRSSAEGSLSSLN